MRYVLRCFELVPVLSEAYILVLSHFQLFRRIIISARHKQRHSYRLSFQEEVGSSFDPDMDDIAHLERTLQGAVARDCPSFFSSLTHVSRRWVIPS